MARVLPKFPSSRLSPQRQITRRQEPALGLRLLGLQPRLEPQELLEFEYRLQRVSQEDVDRLEISVMWYTDGKGDTDFDVHHFQRLDENQIRRSGLADEHELTCELPATPLSYHGRLISVRWCIRMRLFLLNAREFTNGREIVTEHPFYLVAPHSR